MVWKGSEVFLYFVHNVCTWVDRIFRCSLCLKSPAARNTTKHTATPPLDLHYRPKTTFRFYTCLPIYSDLWNLDFSQTCLFGSLVLQTKDEMQILYLLASLRPCFRFSDRKECLISREFSLHLLICLEKVYFSSGFLILWR